MIEGLLKKSAERITFVDQALASGGNFLLTIVMVRTLGLESFGVFTALFIIYLFMLGLQQVLIHAPMMVFFPKAENAKQFLCRYFYFEISLLIICIVIWLVFDWMLASYMPVAWHSVYVVLVISMLLMEFFRKVEILKREPFWVMGFNLPVWISLIVLVLVKINGKEIMLNYFLWIMTCIHAAVIVVGLTRVTLVKDTIQKLLKSLRYSLQYSKWLLSGTLLSWYSGNYLLILAQAQFGLVALGGIRAAQAFLGPINVSLAALENAVTIQGAHIHATEGWSAFRTYWSHRNKFSALFFVGGILSLVLITPWLVRIIYNIDSPEIVVLVRWLLLANLLVIFNTLFRAGFKVIGRTAPVLIISIVQVAFFTLCGYWLLDNFYLNGVAWGIGISQALSVLISTFFWNRYASNYSFSAR